MNTIIANLFGGLIFFWVDKWIFKDNADMCKKCQYKNLTIEDCCRLFDEYVEYVEKDGK